MRAPVSWLRDWVELPAETTPQEIGAALIRAGLEVEQVEIAGGDVTGPLVVGKVLELTPEPQKNGKTINWCTVDVGDYNPEGESGRGIVCGAHNFAVGDHVVVALPGCVLPGDFAIASRKTYGHISDGMICSAAELNLAADAEGIIVLGDTDDEGNALVPGASAREIIHLDDAVLDIAVTPDLGYCLSTRGLAREVAQALHGTFTDPVDRDVPAAVSGGPAVELESEACPLFVALSVTGIDPTRPSPRWMQRGLFLAGMRPISLAVDVTNYVMLTTGQPLHAYDARTISGAIRARQATAGEQLRTLDGVDRTLDAEDLVIADDSGAIGLAGVMGGESTEQGDDTTDVIIEAAHFDARTIGRTSRRHRLSSESSRRFERGVDPNATYAAAHLAARLLVELGGGTLSAQETVVGAVPERHRLTIDVGLPGRVLGADIDAATIVDILTASGADVTASGDALTITAPTWRPDLHDPYDIVEEVGCKYGLDTIESVLPQAPAGRGLTTAQKARRSITAAVTAAGFVEVLTLPFTGSGDLDRMQVPGDDERRHLVTIANPLSDVEPNLRSTLLPGLFAAVRRNTSRSTDDLALVEIGRVFHQGADLPAAPVLPVDRRPSAEEMAALDAALPDQPLHLGAIVTGDWRPAGWSGAAQPAGWQQVIALADLAARSIGIASLDRFADQRAPWHPGRCARLSVRETLVGWAGELHPEVIAAFGLPARTAVVELDLEALIGAAPSGGHISPIAQAPVAKEDVALVVDAEVAVGQVAASLRVGAGDLLEELRLFDIYEGAQIPSGKKSLAFALRFRAPDRTLTDAEAAAARDAAVARAEADWGAQLRT